MPRAVGQANQFQRGSHPAAALAAGESGQQKRHSTFIEPRSARESGEGLKKQSRRSGSASPPSSDSLSRVTSMPLHDALPSVGRSMPR